MSKIGENIRRLRIARGLTQEELAQRVGYTSKSTINKIEQGVNELTQNKIAKFAEALSTSPSVIMGWVSEETSQMNEEMVGVVMAMRKDKELLSMFTRIKKLDAAKRQVVMSLLDAFEASEK